ncbi:TadE/TadG family type IV pilus assembly protein [Novosphingobium sp. PY1]|uniref:TadE/TadG family type IV pilus assembly protein n=1 Tax=Novosphingobium sp. PY1 TaxID=1882221 RepID=UPI001A8E1FA0|nr:TadE/TadG family type IV pilus assembly protein [Novosphingobium sp. PY1]GFM29762.1 TadE-like protein [Novosphingobium sp. PY1]
MIASAALADRIARLGRDRRGVSILEFALILPILITLGLYGTELAYMATINMQVSQIATSVADNASRLGQTDNSSVTPTVTEDQISSVIKGALVEGNAFDFEKNGRIILSSLEKNGATGGQYIHWQRCSGSLAKNSAYGKQGDSVTAMGTSGHTVTAPSGSAVMYAEVYYQYQPLFGTMFTSNTQFHQEAAYVVRDDRNLTPGVTGTSGTNSCS